MRKNNEHLWLLVLRMIDEFKISVRLMVSKNEEPSEWSSWLSFPSGSYVEIAQAGPINKDEVIWIEINNIEIKKRGGRVPDAKIDHSRQIYKILEQESVAFKNYSEKTTRIVLL